MLNTSYIGREIEILQSVDSTNTYAKKIAKKMLLSKVIPSFLKLKLREKVAWVEDLNHLLILEYICPLSCVRLLI